MSQLLLQDGLGVGQVDKSCLVGPDLDISTFIQVHISQDNLVALFDAQVVHHPDRYVAHAFLGRELEHAAVRLDALLGVRDHECHGVLDAHLGKLVQGAIWQDDFISSIELRLAVADRDRTVDEVAAYKHIGLIGVASAEIAEDGLLAVTVVMALTLVSTTTAPITDDFLRVWHLIVLLRVLVSKISSVIIGMIKACSLYLVILILFLLVRFLYLNSLSVFLGLYRFYFFNRVIAYFGLLELCTDDIGTEMVCLLIRADYSKVGIDFINLFSFCPSSIDLVNLGLPLIK